MKKILGTAALALLCLGQASALEPIAAIHGSGRWKGEIYAVSPSFSYHLAVQWNPETDVAPLAVPKAIHHRIHARLKKIVAMLGPLRVCRSEDSDGKRILVLRGDVLFRAPISRDYGEGGNHTGKSSIHRSP